MNFFLTRNTWLDFIHFYLKITLAEKNKSRNKKAYLAENKISKVQIHTSIMQLSLVYKICYVSSYCVSASCWFQEFVAFF